MSSSSKQQAALEQLLKSNKVLHEAIIDLYLQVKIRSNDEIDNFNEGQFEKERDRLLKFDSLTVLDYIRTSIEILMQMKLEDEKGAEGGEKKKALKRDDSEVSNQPQQLSHQKLPPSQTPLSSTTKSLDLPPKEYEQQLQQYEAEVRNHIKVEQQLKLHIEVLQEKLDDLEKEKNLLNQQHEKQRKELENSIRKSFEQALEQKDKEIEKLISELKRAQKAIAGQNQIIEKHKLLQSTGGQNISQQQTVQNTQASNNAQQQMRSNSSQSKSPPGHGGQSYSGGKKIKTVQNGKSPYLNDSFYKMQMLGQQSTNQGSATNPNSSIQSVGNAQPSSTNSSVKSQSQTAQGVPEQIQTTNDGHPVVIKKSQKGQSPVVDNMKVIAAIQRMRMGNQGNQMNAQVISANQIQLQTQPKTSAGGHKKNKSFTHYNTVSNQGQRPSSKGGQGTQHYHTNSDGIGNWLAENPNFNSSFNNEPLSSSQVHIISSQGTEPGNLNTSFNQKIIMKANAGRISVIDQSTTNERASSQKRSRKAQQTEPNQIVFKKAQAQGSSIPDQQQQQQLNESMVQKKNAQVIKASSIRQREGANSSGRASSQGHSNTTGPNTGNQGGPQFTQTGFGHHRIYSIDMIEAQNNSNLSNNNGGGNIAANQQDFSKIQQTVPSQSKQGTIDPSQIKKANQQVQGPQRVRPRSQIGHYTAQNI